LNGLSKASRYGFLTVLDYELAEAANAVRIQMTVEK
jgi:hypothetical protein